MHLNPKPIQQDSQWTAEVTGVKPQTTGVQQRLAPVKAQPLQHRHSALTAVTSLLLLLLLLPAAAAAAIFVLRLGTRSPLLAVLVLMLVPVQLLLCCLVGIIWVFIPRLPSITAAPVPPLLLLLLLLLLPAALVLPFLPLLLLLGILEAVIIHDIINCVIDDVIRPILIVIILCDLLPAVVIYLKMTGV
jgi:hypothetical protein